jgi:hypothetical protein
MIRTTRVAASSPLTDARTGVFPPAPTSPATARGEPRLLIHGELLRRSS